MQLEVDACTHNIGVIAGSYCFTSALFSNALHYWLETRGEGCKGCDVFLAGPEYTTTSQVQPLTGQK